MKLHELITLLSGHNQDAEVSLNGEAFHSLLVRDRHTPSEAADDGDLVWIDIRTVSGTEA